jgi:hypothetical protein
VAGSIVPPAVALGFRGSAIFHSFAWFQQRFGPAACQSVVERIPPVWRDFVRPDEAAMGVLGSRVYPYPFVGDVVRTMRNVVVAKDEDAFVRDLTRAGLEPLLGTMHRLVLRWLVTPKMFLARRQEIWDLYHVGGRLDVLSLDDKSYVIEDAEWSNLDPIVCKVNLEGRIRMLEVIGLHGIRALREKCRAWGHPSCVTRFTWD